MRRTPALIAGGGPAGAITALTLAGAGAEHLLIERQAETADALCGGFLSWRTLDALARLGVDPDMLNRRKVMNVTLFGGDHSVTARLPRPARAVSRRRLDSILLDLAARAGAAIERGAAARAVEERVVRLDDGSEIAPDALFLATGKHDLRGIARPTPTRGDDPAVGLRVRLGPAPALDRLIGNRIELHLFDRGYAGVVLQEDGTANCCMAVRRSRLAEAGNPQALLVRLGSENPALGERLAWCGDDATVDAVANVPYGWRAREGTSGLFRLGDQAAVIPSLAGEGIGIAIASGVRAARAYLGGGSAAAPGYQGAFARDTAHAVGLAELIWRVGESPRAAAAALRIAGIAPRLIQVAATLTRIGHIPK
jgi:flavin-dependent dehydrogenase